MLSSVNYVVCNVVGLLFLQECSDPITDGSSGRDMIPFMVHRCGTTDKFYSFEIRFSFPITCLR